MYKRTRIAPAVLGVLAALLIGFTAQQPANAAIHVLYSQLSPVAMAADVTIPNSGSCTDSDSNAAVSSPYPAQWLKLIAAQTGSSSTKIMIDLDSIGNVLGSHIVKSSGNTFLDEQALIAANGSKYVPEVRNCSSFKRSYYLNITFTNTSAVLPEANAGDARRPVR